MSITMDLGQEVIAANAPYLLFYIGIEGAGRDGDDVHRVQSFCLAYAADGFFIVIAVYKIVSCITPVYPLQENFFLLL